MNALLMLMLLAQADAGTPLQETSVVEMLDGPRPETLEEKVDRLEAELESVRVQQSWLAKLSASVGGYLDVGFFWVQGNGSGVRPDLGHRYAPRYAGEVNGAWVLFGDPLSTAVNSRGDVADLGDSRAIRFDPIHAGNRPTFLVNNLNLILKANLGEGLSVVGMVDFLPRERLLTTPSLSVGDFIDLKLAFASYAFRAGDWGAFELYAGKIDSVLGIEYRHQESPMRTTVTPSLICRYTCGRPVGAKVRGHFLSDRLDVSVALTNGTHQSDQFTFTDETDSNWFKTVAGQIGWHFDVGDGLELNASGAIGPQDKQPDDRVVQWHYGFAAHLKWAGFTAMAEFVSGRAHGKRGVDSYGGAESMCGATPCIDYRGAYGLLAWNVVPLLEPYARVDWRNAFHRKGNDFVYLSNVLRVTAGVRFKLGDFASIKAEYVLNRELGPFEFADDVLTTSLVVRY